MWQILRIFHKSAGSITENRTIHAFKIYYSNGKNDQFMNFLQEVVANFFFLRREIFRIHSVHLLCQYKHSSDLWSILIHYPRHYSQHGAVGQLWLSAGLTLETLAIHLADKMHFQAWQKRSNKSSSTEISVSEEWTWIIHVHGVNRVRRSQSSLNLTQNEFPRQYDTPTQCWSNAGAPS